MFYSTNLASDDLKAFAPLFKDFAISTQEFDRNTIIRCPDIKR